MSNSITRILVSLLLVFAVSTVAVAEDRNMQEVWEFFDEDERDLIGLGAVKGVRAVLIVLSAVAETLEKDDDLRAEQVRFTHDFLCGALLRDGEDMPAHEMALRISLALTNPFYQNQGLALAIVSALGDNF